MSNLKQQIVTEVQKKRLLIVDLDALVFLASLRNVEEEKTVLNTLEHVDNYIKGVQVQSGANEVIMVMEPVLGGKPGPRMEIHDGYKDRTGDAKTDLLLAVKSHIQDSWDVKMAKKWESDDVISYYAKKFPGSYILGNDKDLAQHACRFINLRTPGEYTICTAEGGVHYTNKAYFHGLIGLLYQAVAGDKVDTYSNCSIPGEMMLKYCPTKTQVKAITDGKEPKVGAAKAGDKTSYQLLVGMSHTLTLKEMVAELMKLDNFIRNWKLATMYANLDEMYYKEQLQSLFKCTFNTDKPTIVKM